MIGFRMMRMVLGMGLGIAVVSASAQTKPKAAEDSSFSVERLVGSILKSMGQPQFVINRARVEMGKKRSGVEYLDLQATLPLRSAIEYKLLDVRDMPMAQDFSQNLVIGQPGVVIVAKAAMDPHNKSDILVDIGFNSSGKDVGLGILVGSKVAQLEFVLKRIAARISGTAAVEKQIRLDASCNIIQVSRAIVSGGKDSALKYGPVTSVDQLCNIKGWAFKDGSDWNVSLDFGSLQPSVDVTSN